MSLTFLALRNLTAPLGKIELLLDLEYFRVVITILKITRIMIHKD